MPRYFRRLGAVVWLPFIVIVIIVSAALWWVKPGLPAARYGAMMVFDALENRAILFGGRADGLLGERYFNDLWVFDYSARSWSHIKTSSRPQGRLSPGLVYDPDNHQIILFGGLGAKERLGDTWIYHIAQNQWQEVTPAISPAPRSAAGMAYDEANHVVVLFSGYCQEDTRQLCDDTWVYEPQTNLWREMQPTSSPLMMYGQSLLYDPGSQQTVLWGGHQSIYKNEQLTSIGYTNSLWRYDYLQNAWQETAQVSKPPARYWHQAAFDTANSALIVFGGNGANGFLGDTWRLDDGSNAWKRVNAQPAPSPRVNAAITYDPVNKVVILFAGLEADMTNLRDTWVFQITPVGAKWSRLDAR